MKVLERDGMFYVVAIEPEGNVACICTFANEKREVVIKEHTFYSTTCIASI